MKADRNLKKELIRMERERYVKEMEKVKEIIQSMRTSPLPLPSSEKSRPVKPGIQSLHDGVSSLFPFSCSLVPSVPVLGLGTHHATPTNTHTIHSFFS